MSVDVERQPLLGDGGAGQTQLEPISNVVTTVSPIGPDELPPSYSSLAGGVPMVSCRICSNMIDISGKKDQVSRTT